MRHVKSVTTKQIQDLDRFAINQIGISSLALMETAGRHIADVICKNVARIEKPLVVIVCGIGNNAGDGFVAARHLLNRDVRLKVLCIGSSKKIKSDALCNYKALENCGVDIKQFKKIDSSFHLLMKGADIVVDAILGVGLNREIQEPFYSIIEEMNISARFVLSVDVPSGLDATTGNIYGICVKAKSTVTFSYSKKGFGLKEGPAYVGRLSVVDIGIPKKTLLMSKGCHE